jgi:Protein of unknown function (DUF4238)
MTSAKSSNQKKRHHYVPITYLEKFADDAGKILAYRKDEVRKALHVRPSELAFERYYYSQPLRDGGRDNNTLEDFFSTIEGTWTPLLTRLRLASDTPSDFEAICTFMSLMRVRVLATRDMVEISRAEQIKATTRLLDRIGMLPPKPEAQTPYRRTAFSRHVCRETRADSLRLE